MAMVFVLLAVFGGLYRKLKLSLVSYFFIFLWCYMQVIGAHYTFELVPFELPYGINAESGYVTLFPHREGCDGFFIAKLRRKI